MKHLTTKCYLRRQIIGTLGFNYDGEDDDTADDGKINNNTTTNNNNHSNNTKLDCDPAASSCRLFVMKFS